MWISRYLAPLRATYEGVKARMAPMTPRFRVAQEILGRAINDGAFPGASLCVGGEERVETASVGRFEYSSESPQVTADAAFDLASLTKVITTTTVAMLLWERGDLRMDEAIVKA